MKTFKQYLTEAKLNWTREWWNAQIDPRGNKVYEWHTTLPNGDHIVVSPSGEHPTQRFAYKGKLTFWLVMNATKKKRFREATFKTLPQAKKFVEEHVKEYMQ